MTTLDAVFTELLQATYVDCLVYVEKSSVVLMVGVRTVCRILSAMIGDGAWLGGHSHSTSRASGFTMMMMMMVVVMVAFSRLATSLSTYARILNRLAAVNGDKNVGKCAATAVAAVDG
uniref:Uncharacterized protein n=1 Tax=Romanomermis culicivorax TaxID=13658 RepID=A0A915IB46_ROMCU